LRAPSASSSTCRAGDPRRLNGGTDCDEVGGLGDDLEAVAEVVDLLRAGVEDDLEQVVLRQGALRDDDDALAVEDVGDAAGVGELTAVAGQGRPHLRGRAVAVVGEALDEHRDTVRRVSLVGDALPVSAAGLGPGAALDRAVDVVVGDRGLLGLLDGVEERRIADDVAAAGAGGDLDVLDELGKELAAPRVDDCLLVLRRRPFGVAAHDLSLTISTNNSWTRVSPVTSGWNEVASRCP